MRVLSLTSALVALTSMALASVDAAWPDNGATRLHGVNYDTQKCRTAQEELDDLTAIAKIAKSVRIYGIRTDRASPACPTSRLLATARDKVHITVHLGMWLDGNADKQIDGKLQDLRDVLKYLDSNVVGFHVGSEAIYRGNYSADKAISYLQRVRKVLEGKNIPVTIADVVDSYYQNPQLIDAVDYVSINQFSFWEKVDINYAMVKMLDRIRSIRAQAAAKNKAVMISETGWSSGGYDTKNRVGEPSDANERQFFTNFYHQATAHGLPYYYFVAFEAPWNTEDQFATVEQHFGLLDYYSRQLKPAVANLDLSPRTIVTLQSARGLLAETFNAAQPETVDGVEIIQPSNDKLTQVRYKWFFDAAKQQYRSLNSDRCLDAYQPQDGGIVHTYQCVDSERNQRWIYDAKTQQLKHASHTGFCLEDHTASGKLELWTCDAFKDNQRFGLNGAPATGSDLTPGTVSPGQPTTTSPVPTTTAPAPSTCSIEENVDYAGNDIGSAASATAEGCCSICQARSGCKAFTWTNYVGGTCWLKSSNTGKSSKPGARSSVLSSTTTPPPVPTTTAPVPTTTAPVPTTTAPVPTTTAPVPTTTAPVPTTTAPVPTTTAPVPTTAAPAPSTCTIEENVDYAGNDIGSAASATAEGCCSICQARSGCKAFTWTNYVGGTCWLKSSNTGKSSKSGARSAVVSSTTTPPPQSQCSAVELNVDYSGKDIGNAPSSSVDGCCNICAQRSGCGAYTWSDYNGGTCWLKSEKGTSTPKAGAKSAVYNGGANTCTLVNGIDYYGNDLASAASATAAGCCSICKGRTGCTVFTWTSDNGGTCWLKTAQGTPVPKTGAVSGKV